MTRAFSHNEDAELDYRLRAGRLPHLDDRQDVHGLLSARLGRQPVPAISRLWPRPRQEHPEAPHAAEAPPDDPAAGGAGGGRRIAGVPQSGGLDTGRPVGGGLHRLRRLDGASASAIPTARWPAFSAMVMHLAWSVGFWLQLLDAVEARGGAVMTGLRQDQAARPRSTSASAPSAGASWKRRCARSARSTVPPDATVRVIVADNDVTPSARRAGRCRCAPSCRSSSSTCIARPPTSRSPATPASTTAAATSWPSSTMTRRHRAEWLAELLKTAGQRQAPTPCSARCAPSIPMQRRAG